jgi:hypothetical protein
MYERRNITPVEIVECKNSQCQIVTKIFALKVKYQEDKSQDFKIIDYQIIIDVYEIYRELTTYAHTTYIKYNPPHVVEWLVISTQVQRQYLQNGLHTNLTCAGAIYIVILTIIRNIY